MGHQISSNRAPHTAYRHHHLQTQKGEQSMIRRTLASAARPLSSRCVSDPELIVEADCSWRKIGAQVASHGRTCLAVLGDDTSSEAERCLFELRKIGINCAVFTAQGAYPTVDGIDEARGMAKRIGAGSIVGIGGGGTVDTAKGVARLYTSSGGCKHFLRSPSGLIMGEGGKGEPQAPVGDGLPVVMVPTSAGAGAGVNGRCLVWHPEDEVLVPMAETPGGGQPASVSLLDPNLCASLSKAHTAAMALTTLSACVDALLAWELASVAGRTPEGNGDTLLRLGTRGIGAVAEGLPVVLAGEKDGLARELLTIGSVCAGQLSVITPAPPTQLMARAAGSLVCRNSYPSICAMVFPHVVRDMLDQANSFDGDAQVAEAIERALSRTSCILLGEGNDGQAFLSWLETQERDWLSFSNLSTVDPTITAKEVVTNIEMLLALEEDSDAADRVWGSRALDVAELVVG